MEQPEPAGAARPAGGRTLPVAAISGFVVLGLADGMWGASWPSMRATFDEPLGFLGYVLLAGTAGSLVSSLLCSLVVRRRGAHAVLVAAGAFGLCAGLLIAFAPRFWFLPVAAVLVGLAAGFLDTTLNTVVSLAGRARLLNTLHGSYGVGASLGPLLVTVALLVASWRSAYVVLAGFEALLALTWWRTRSLWRAGSGVSLGGDEDVAPDARPLDRALAAAGVVTFFVYTGLEVSAGQWAASYFRGAEHFSASAASGATSLYWGALTLSRFATAVPRGQPNPGRLVRFGLAASLLASLLVWWRPAPVVAIAGFVLMGAALAPVFPALISLTAVRVGRAHAHRTIGWQVGAANVGGAGLSAVTGAVLERFGLVALGPALVVGAVALLASNAVLEFVARPSAPG